MFGKVGQERSLSEQRVAIAQVLARDHLRRRKLKELADTGVQVVPQKRIHVFGK